MATVSSATHTIASSAFLDANFVVPVVVLAFVALNVGNDPKYAGLRSAIAALLQNPRQLVPEISCFLVVVLAVAAGLLLSPDGLLASLGDLKKKYDLKDPAERHLFELRKVWPVLLNPDSLLSIQQLMLGLAVSLLLIRGACSQGSNMLALGLVLLSAGQGLRFSLWLENSDYVPEGPLGHEFAAACSFFVLVVLTLSATKAVLSARAHGFSMVRNGSYLAMVLTLCAWVSKENHMTASDSDRLSMTFSLVDAVELCAAPLLAIAACSLASEVSHLGGALASLVAAQTLGVFWFLDFTGILSDPNSEDPLVQQTIALHHGIMSFVHGHPYVLFAVGQAVRMLGAFAACVGYAMLRLSKPDFMQENVSARPQNQPFLEVEAQTLSI